MASRRRLCTSPTLVRPVNHFRVGRLGDVVRACPDRATSPSGRSVTPTQTKRSSAESCRSASVWRGVSVKRANRRRAAGARPPAAASATGAPPRPAAPLLAAACRMNSISARSCSRRKRWDSVSVLRLPARRPRRRHRPRARRRRRDPRRPLPPAWACAPSGATMLVSCATACRSSPRSPSGTDCRRAGT